ncbi:hypothetical protein [Puerhibacterium sp. TATVAM-FAB25]|uniref:hypothetical protein n=1 Tax=Puerhibacterium sp. TATVAM-FAB25 TaxID=3093699 RepID=UPI00397E6EFD
MRRSRTTVRAFALAGSALVVVALAACASPSGAGGPSDEAPTAGSPDPSLPSAAPPAAPSDGTDDRRPDATAMELAPGSAGRGLPDGVGPTAAPLSSPAGAAWSPVTGLLYVVTYGSSSCPVLAEPEAPGDAAGVTVTLVPPSGDRMCTADWAATTSVVAVPVGADAGTPLAVTLGDHGVVEVSPRPAAGATGPAAWVPAD